MDTTFGFALAGIMRRLTHDSDAAQLTVGERLLNDSEEHLDRVAFRTVAGLLVLSRYLPTQHQPPTPDDEFDPDEDTEESPGPEELLHHVPMDVVFEALREWLEALCEENARPKATTTFRVRILNRTGKRLWSRSLAFTHKDSSTLPTLHRPDLLAGAGVRPNLDLPSGDDHVPRPDALRMTVGLEESVGKALATVATAHAQLIDIAVYSSNQQRKMYERVLDTALETNKAAQQENAELRAKNAELFAFVLEERQRNIKAGEKAIEDRKKAIEAEKANDRTKHLIEEGVKLIGDLGGMAILSRKPELFGLRPAHMTTLRKLMANPDVDRLLQDPDMLELVEDPAFATAIQTMIEHKKAFKEASASDQARETAQ